MRRFVVPIAVVSILILLGGLTAGLVSAIGPTPPAPTRPPPPPDETVTGTSVSDLVALISLYKATDGPNWRYNTNWLSETPVGEWYGVSVDSSGRVVGLNLYGNGLSGTIPGELSRLTNLRWLSFYGNQLSGEIPPELGNLTNLQSLRLYNNQLSGEIPSELGGLANLVLLSLEGNQLSGEIPSELGNLVNLQSLILSRNELSGEIPPELGNLANLVKLSLEGNQLSGEIPSELGNLVNLQSLWLYSNELSGEIPSELGNLANLQSLWLYSNELSGEIPSELGGLANLVLLSLEGNQLSGEIPPELGNLANLVKLSLEGNQLSGEIPSELGNLVNLQSLWLYSNELSGEIPSELGNLANLQSLWLYSNELSGEIPSELGNLANLEWLVLSGNQLEGCIPWRLEGVENSDLGELGLPFCPAPGGPIGNVVTGVRVEAVPNYPNVVAKWVVKFQNGTIRNTDQAQMDGANTMRINTNEENNILNGEGKDVIMIEFEDDVQIPAALSPSDVVITTNKVAEADGTVTDRTVVVNPLGVDIIKVSEFAGNEQRTDKPPDETLITLEIPDMDDSDQAEGSQGIAPGATVTVVFRQNAGIKNPSESKPDQVNQAQRAAAVDLNGNFDASLLKPLSGYKVQVATSNNGYFVPAALGNRAVIPRRFVMSDEDGPRGSIVTVVGIGFRNSITATVWNDQNQNGARDRGEIDLSSALVTGSDDFTTTITINNPPFSHDLNTNGINAVDGRNRTIIPGRRYMGAISGATFTESIPTYLLESSIKVNLSTAAIGDTVHVTARDFVPGGNIANARTSIGGVAVTEVENTVVSDTGDAAFEITIPNGVASGVQNLVIKDGPNALFDPTHDIVNTGGARFNIVISGAQLSMTPSYGLVPNQTVTLVGRGFSTGGAAEINVDGSDATISGDDTDLGPRSEKFNEGNPIEVDNAGNWSSSFVIPITDVTTTPGNHELSITDTGGRSGSVDLNMAERRLTLTPASGRVGTRVDIKGYGFPADNPAQGGDTTVAVEILYSTIASGPQSVVTLTPDGSGNIRGWFTVPLDAGIPSTNAVRAVFEVPASNVIVTTSTVHAVAIQSVPGGPIIAGANSLTVAWAAPASGPAVTVYDLRYIRTDADETVEVNWTVVEDVWTIGFTPLEYVLTGLTAGMQYDVQLRAVNVAGTGPWSATATATPSTWGAIRYLSQTYVEPGGEVVVTITATGYGLYGEVVETLPPGFSYTGSNLSDDAVIVSGWEVTFFLRRGEERFTYTVTAPGAAREYPPTPTPTPTSRAARELLPTPTPTPTPTPAPRPPRRRAGGGGEYSPFGGLEYSFFGGLVNENRLQQTVGGASSIRVGAAPLVYAINDAATLVRIDSPIPVTVTFSEPVFGFSFDDISVANGVISNFTVAAGEAVYTFDVTPNAIGAVTVDIAFGVATGADGDGNSNIAAPRLSLGIPYDDDGDGGISKEEAITAVIDYFAGRITKAEAIGVIILYFSS